MAAAFDEQIIQNGVDLPGMAPYSALLPVLPVLKRLLSCFFVRSTSRCSGIHPAFVGSSPIRTICIACASTDAM